MSSEPQAPHAENTVEWFYEDAGQRIGPVVRQEMDELIRTKRVNSGTLVWSKEFREWTPLVNTSLWNANDPPPLTARYVNNNLAWLIAFLPIVYVAIDATVSQLRLQQWYQLARAIGTASSFGLPWYAYAMATCVITWIDAKRIHKAGYKVNLPIITLCLPPVYLFIRAHRLKQPPYYGIAWVVSGRRVALDQLEEITVAFVSNRQEGPTMLSGIRTAIRQFGPRGDPVLKWAGFAATFGFVIAIGYWISLAISAAVLLFRSIIARMAEQLRIDPTLTTLALVALAAIYLLPTAIAYTRHHRNRLAIAALNIIAGWLFVGWLVALGLELLRQLGKATTDLGTLEEAVMATCLAQGIRP